MERKLNPQDIMNCGSCIITYFVVIIHFENFIISSYEFIYSFRHGDSLKFGRSSRDLVLLNESAAEGAELSYSEFADSDVSKQREALRVGSK